MKNTFVLDVQNRNSFISLGIIFYTTGVIPVIQVVKTT